MAIESEEDLLQLIADDPASAINQYDFHQMSVMIATQCILTNEWVYSKNPNNKGSG